MKPKVLVVDDSEIVLQWMRVVLGRDFLVVTRNSSVGTGAAVVREAPDLVLLALEMPLMRGDDLVVSIRRSAAGRNTLIALYSKAPRAELEAKMAACGADAIICKADDEQEFRDRVREIVVNHDGNSPVRLSSQGSSTSHAGANESRRAIVAGESTLTARETEILTQDCQLELHIAHTADEVCEQLRSETPEPRLLVIGGVLPDATPSELCHTIRENEDLRYISVLMVSDVHLAECTAVAFGVNECVIRPVSRAQLARAALKLIRVAPRRDVRILVRARPFPRGGPSRYGFTRNLSASGMLLETDQPVDVGDTLDLRFFVPGVSTEVITGAAVVRHHEPPNYRWIVGMQFMQLKAVHRRNIGQFVQS
jgi:DNA-binding response OmpR family regulator